MVRQSKGKGVYEMLSTNEGLLIKQKRLNSILEKVDKCPFMRSDGQCTYKGSDGQCTYKGTNERSSNPKLCSFKKDKWNECPFFLSSKMVKGVTSK